MNPFRIYSEYKYLLKECTSLAIENVKLHKKQALRDTLVALLEECMETLLETERKRDYYKAKYFKLKESQEKR